MTEFKVGDRVRLTGEDWYGGEGDPEKGDIVEITRVSEFSAFFKWRGREWYIEEGGYDAELVTAATLEADEDSDRDYDAVLSAITPHYAPDAIVPDHYAFPGGVRVHHISGHLTSFGGQAVQYIARSTRLDGKNKGDRVENLKKAQRMIDLEIERLEAE